MTQFKPRLFGGKLFAGRLFRGATTTPDQPITVMPGAPGRHQRPDSQRRRNRDDDALLFLLR